MDKMSEEKKKTILFVMPRLPFPASSGRKTSLYHYCRILGNELGHYLIVAAFLENSDDPVRKPDFINKLIILPKASAKERIINIIVDSFILRKKPIQVSLYWSCRAKQQIDELIKLEQPEVVIGDMVRSTEYIKDLNTFKVADLDDRISLRYKRQLETAIGRINPYGAFINTVPRFLRKIMLLKPLASFVMKNEIMLLKRYELEMGKLCNRVVFVAKNEVIQFNKELREEKAIDIPIGVDTNYFSYRITGCKGNIIGFLGAMSVAHNEYAVKYFVANILPDILKKISDVRFMVIGGGASDDLLKLASAHVEFMGRVEDVRTYLEMCKVFVCPMTFGSGIKTKNLEAMSMGLPVVTTSIGAENINAKEGEEWLIADEKLDFSEKVIEILNNDKKRIEIGKNGSEFIRNNFTWDVAKEQFEKLFQQV